MKTAVTSWKNVPLMMDISYAAIVLGKTCDNVTKMCQKGKLPAIKAGGVWRIEKTQLMIYCGVPEITARQETGIYTGEELKALGA